MSSKIPWKFITWKFGKSSKNLLSSFAIMAPKIGQNPLQLYLVTANKYMDFLYALSSQIERMCVCVCVIDTLAHILVSIGHETNMHAFPWTLGTPFLL